MPQKALLCCLICLPLAFMSKTHAHGKLDATQLEEKFSDTTQLCRKEKDQSTCTTYFSADGIIKRRMHANDKRRQGSWEIDLEQERICITWEGKTRALCFDAYLNKDGTLDMYKGGRHLSTVISFTPGNSEDL